MRTIFLMLFLSFVHIASAQFSIPAYNLVKDSATHITVFHFGNAEKIRLGQGHYTDTLSLISPDIRIKDGIVDHKGMTGEMLVREYYVDSILIGYIEYDGPSFLRERYIYPDGSVFLDKQYDKGILINQSNEKYLPLRK
jgi:hypothetical protein